MLCHTGVWVLGEQRHGIIQEISFELLARARGLADKRETTLTAVILGKTAEADLQKLIQRGADRVIAVQTEKLNAFLPEPYATALLYLIRKHKPEILLAGATSLGRTLLPLVAIKCHAGLTADCTDFDIENETGNLLQTRPAIGGDIMATIKTPNHRPQMATVRPRSTKPMECDESRSGEIVHESLDSSQLTSRIRRLGTAKATEGVVNLTEADVIVSGGRGLKKGENFSLLQELADLLGGAVGASRDAVDRGWISYPHQVGLSGKTVSPKLYLCAGISGSVQHLAGIKTAEHIVAVNTNPDAPIMQVADYGIVGDLFEILPLLIDRIKARQAKSAG